MAWPKNKRLVEPDRPPTFTSCTRHRDVAIPLPLKIQNFFEGKCKDIRIQTKGTAASDVIDA